MHFASSTKPVIFSCATVVWICFIFLFYNLDYPIGDQLPLPKPSTYFYSKDVVDPKTSTVSIIGNQRTFRVGEKLHLLIRLRDKKGYYIIEGGDVLRIWLSEGKSNVNGDVVDHGNGSYTGSVLLPWSGAPKVHVTIANTRQAIKNVMTVLENTGLLYPMNAKFVNSKNKYAVTRCSPMPRQDIWNETCNLTDINYNVEWYCEKPSNPEISCRDWRYVSSGGTADLPMKTVVWMRVHKHMALKTDFNITVKGERMLKSNIRCSESNRSFTWTNISPSGFYRNGSWVNLLCRSKIKKSKENYRSCLNNRHLILIGDSNTRSYTFFLKSYLKLKMFSRYLVRGKPWQESVFLADPKSNITVYWAPHGIPFFSPPFILKDLLKPAFVHLNRIGKHNNSIILIHMYIHLARVKPEVFRYQIKLLRSSIENLLKRSPDVDIAIKGPHAITNFNLIDPLDYFKSWQRKVWFEEFRGLHHKVIYLDMWDMSVGSKNINVHPGAKTLSDMIHSFFSYACKI